ncbi:MAG: hypothetical protein VX663_06960 [Pseudomonadota bacterium]|nr:hypothetical protein [Pseudomonadota bacterium]
MSKRRAASGQHRNETAVESPEKNPKPGELAGTSPDDDDEGDTGPAGWLEDYYNDAELPEELPR